MKKEKYFIIIFLIISNLVIFSSFLELQEEQDLEVIFFDVGQGDAALIKTPQRHNILIDGGPDKKLLTHLNKELPFWNRDIDLIILSHSHADHLSGLVEVIERYNVKNVLWNEQKTDSLVYKKWKLLQKDLNSRRAYRGQRVYAGEVVLDVLHPTKDYDKSDNPNANSMVNRLVNGDQSILFTGDIYKKQEENLLEWENNCKEQDFSYCRVMNLSAEVLKIPHHGSSSSTDYDFIKRVDPGVGLISVGKDNRYGHPHEETINNLKSLEVDIHKTFEDGNLRVTIDF